MAWHGMAWHGMKWHGICHAILCRAVPCRAMPCRAMPYGMARHGTAWHSTARHGMAWHGRARHGMARHGTARHGMARHGMIWHVHGWCDVTSVVCYGMLFITLKFCKEIAANWMCSYALEIEVCYLVRPSEMIPRCFDPRVIFLSRLIWNREAHKCALIRHRST